MIETIIEVVGLVVRWLSRVWIGVPFVRRSLVHRAKFEGIWLEDCTKASRRWSIGVICYDWVRNIWIYRGVAYKDSTLKKGAWWDTTPLASPQRVAFGSVSWWPFLGRAASDEHPEEHRVSPFLMLPQTADDKFDGRVTDLNS